MGVFVRTLEGAQRQEMLPSWGMQVVDMSLRDDEIQACVNYMNAGDLDDLVAAVGRVGTPPITPVLLFWGSVDYHGRHDEQG